MNVTDEKFERVVLLIYRLFLNYKTLIFRVVKFNIYIMTKNMKFEMSMAIIDHVTFHQSHVIRKPYWDCGFRA